MPAIRERPISAPSSAMPQGAIRERAVGQIEQPGMLRTAGDFLESIGPLSVGRGVLKGMAESGYGAANLVNKGLRAILPESLSPAPFPSESQKFLEPVGPGQTVGKFAERVAEYMVPGGAIKKAATGLL